MTLVVPFSYKVLLNVGTVVMSCNRKRIHKSCMVDARNVQYVIVILQCVELHSPSQDSGTCLILLMEKDHTFMAWMDIHFRSCHHDIVCRVYCSLVASWGIYASFCHSTVSEYIQDLKCGFRCLILIVVLCYHNTGNSMECWALCGWVSYASLYNLHSHLHICV